MSVSCTNLCYMFIEFCLVVFVTKLHFLSMWLIQCGDCSSVSKFTVEILFVWLLLELPLLVAQADLKLLLLVSCLAFWNAQYVAWTKLLNPDLSQSPASPSQIQPLPRLAHSKTVSLLFSPVSERLLWTLCCFRLWHLLVKCSNSVQLYVHSRKETDHKNQLQCPKCSQGAFKIMPPVLFRNIKSNCVYVFKGFFFVFCFYWLFFLIHKILYIKFIQVICTYTHFPAHEMVILGLPYAYFFLLIFYFFIFFWRSNWRPDPC